MTTAVVLCTLLAAGPGWTSARVDFLAELDTVSIACTSSPDLTQLPSPDPATQVCPCPIKRGLAPTACQAIVVESDMATAAGCLVTYPLAAARTVQKPIRWRTLQTHQP